MWKLSGRLVCQFRPGLRGFWPRGSITSASGYGGMGAYYSGMNTAGLYSGLSGGYQGYLTGAAMLTNADAQWRFDHLAGQACP